MGDGQGVHLLPQTNQLRAMHTVIRDRDASRHDFISYSRRIIRLLIEEGLNLLPFESRDVTTPVGQTYHGLGLPTNLCGVSVVRAGESMEAELMDMLPGIRIGKILIQRDRKTMLPQLYYRSLPNDIADRFVLLMEPMLATGGSLITAIDVLCEAGVPADHVVVINFLAAPLGLKAVHEAYPEVQLVTSAIEDGLNENAYMVPGIGDFGDRYFGTEIQEVR